MKKALTIKYLFLFLLCANYTVSAQNVLPKDSVQVSEVFISHEAGKVYGSLVVPQTDYNIPLVIFISGSGPTDRDGNQAAMENDCFKLLARALADNEIANLRFDKRGIGASSELTMAMEDMRFEHFVNDISLWIKKYKKDSRFSKIIVMGHSLGSLMGMVASRQNPPDAFISLAGPGRSIDESIFMQLKKQSPFIANGAKPILDSLKAGLKVKEVHPFLQGILPPHLHDYIASVMQYNPAEELAKLDIPTFIIQGQHDIQVTEEDYNLLLKAAPQSEYMLIDSMNHILKNAPADRMGNLAIYNNPDAPINKELIKGITNFVLQLN
jgi:pimeloyl-ACP methyl ester carboxylesterase